MKVNSGAVPAPCVRTRTPTAYHTRHTRHIHHTRHIRDVYGARGVAAVGQAADVAIYTSA
jgi:hypothetical protein